MTKDRVSINVLYEDTSVLTKVDKEYTFSDFDGWLRSRFSIEKEDRLIFFSAVSDEGTSPL